MKAIIFNSGLGSRMGDLTKNRPKCLVELYNGETIFDRQIRILSECGIKEFVITVGPFKEQIIAATKKYNDLIFDFVENNKYLNTNYIVSMDNANELLNDDFLLLHGDLVFNKELVVKMINSKEKNLCLYNKKKKLPKKDFKGRFKNNILKEVSISIFDDDCFTFQPLYKLDKDTIIKWKNNVRKFVSQGQVNVYAENALNEITNNITIIGMSYEEDFIDEIDNEEDYLRVSLEIKEYDIAEQVIEYDCNYAEILKKYIDKNDKIFLVCGNNLKDKINNDLRFLDSKILFSDFSPNPKYNDIKKGVDLFKKSSCNKIVSIGGGSTIDVAKCIKLFSTLENELDFLEKKFKYNNIIHIAIPTTAGTGSESTNIAVMYYNNIKLSIYHESIFPQIAILDSSFLNNLSDYQKKSTMLDSLCQSIESYWSRSATIRSKNYSEQCINIILNNYKYYLKNEKSSFKEILKASNLSGKAINITRTTAPHSMSYSLTTKYKISHGHAVALCLIPCWKLLENMSHSNFDIKNRLEELAHLLDSKDIKSSIEMIDNIIKNLNLPKFIIDEESIEELVENVNIERLSNNLIVFNKKQLKKIYKSINNN